MVHITNTTNTLGNFVVRDDTGSYDNEYNEILIANERQAAIQAAGRALLQETLNVTSRGLRAVGRGALTFVEALDEAVSTNHQDA